ncbi:helix-turn-helix transcriptional regulator [Candidatus Gracilibacteria bacterium]|nr:helix-turn-helix transcriptional regulator [Candidatus Gracilibacteria bacterium]
MPCTVLSMVAAGASNRVIANKLGISEKMIEYRLRQLSQQLGVHTKPELAAWWSRLTVETLADDLAQGDDRLIEHSLSVHRLERTFA